MIDIYEKRKDGVVYKFVHISTDSKGRYHGKMVDPYLHTQDITLSPRKMVAKGWLRKVGEPDNLDKVLFKDMDLDALENTLNKDVQHLSKMIQSGAHVIRIGDVLEMLKPYAKFVDDQRKSGVKNL